MTSRANSAGEVSRSATSPPTHYEKDPPRMLRRVVSPSATLALFVKYSQPRSPASGTKAPYPHAVVQRPVYPISLLLENRPCLVIGAGSIALGKIQELLLAGAVVTVIAPEAIAEVASLPVTLFEREFHAGDTEDFALVISATGIREVDAAVFNDASGTATLVNAADNPDSCTFFLPALFRRGDLSVAISTGGVSPAIASWVRERLGDTLDERFGEIVDFVGVTRDAVRSRGLSTEGLPWSELIDQMVAAVESGSGAARCRALCDLWLEGVLSAPAAGEQGVDE